MNRDILNSLQNSMEPAPEMPEVVVRALAGRRLRRRLVRTSVSTVAVVALASLVLVVRGVGPVWGGRGGGGAGGGENPAMIADVTSGDVTQWPADLPEDGPITIASLYTGASASNHEATESPASDRVLRIGDQWDLERVTEWVLK